MLRNLIESKRHTRGLSLRELAREANVSHTTIFRALQEDRVDMDTLIKLAEWLKVKPSNLVNSLANSEDSLPDKIAVVLDLHPTLKSSFEHVTSLIQEGNVDPALIEDIVAYAVYRTRLAIEK
jgi:transcriptional regulator with XRE-family HTH domain